MSVLGRDAWIHPLRGPDRRMPIRDSRVFGANRPGHRPYECKNGHCGVDLGGEAWGEPVLAVHDGVVDHVERGHNPNGGRYVRLAHDGGKVFTEYFHLAAIPPRVEPGNRIDMGEVVGLVGATGVDHSGPHLHFTISVKPAERLERKFVDPEPLIALWPLKKPIGCGTGSTVSTTEPPGFVRGAANRRRRSRAELRREVASDDSAAPADAGLPVGKLGTEPLGPKGRPSEGAAVLGTVRDQP